MKWHYDADDNAHYATGVTGLLRVAYAIEVWSWEVAVCGECIAEGSASTMDAAQAAAIEADRKYTREMRA